MPPTPVTILGRGIAGAMLYEALRERGARVRVIDRPLAGSASRIAPGVVNPVALRHLAPCWRVTSMLPLAEATYRRLEKHYDRSFWHPIPLVKVFADERERVHWERASNDPTRADLLSLPRDHPGGVYLRAPFGAGVVHRCAWVDVAAFLDAQRERMLAEGVLTELVDHPDSSDDRAAGNGPTIQCTGAYADPPGLVPVKGEVLTVRVPGLGVQALVHRGVFLLPVGDDLYRLGSTFAWDQVWSGPTDRARDELLVRLARITDLPVEVVGHQAGVRPTARDRRPMLGRTAADPGKIVFNGLGTRGVMLAPWCAMHLADHVLTGSPLDAEVDAARFPG